MFFILRTGAAWRDMPEKYGPGATVCDRFREWRDAQVCERLWARCLHYYERKYGIIREWQSNELSGLIEDLQLHLCDGLLRGEAHLFLLNDEQHSILLLI